MITEDMIKMAEEVIILIEEWDLLKEREVLHLTKNKQGITWSITSSSKEVPQ